MTRILSLLILIISAVSAVAQDNLVIYLDGQATDLSSGSAPQMIAAPSEAIFSVTFNVYNNSANTQKWRITRSQISVPAGWADGLCWGHATDPFGGSCYSSTQMNTSLWTSPGIAAALFDILPGAHGKLKPDFNPADGISGTGHYRYYITNASGTTYLDSVDVIVDYVADVKPLKDPVTVTLVPNPADDYINISVSGTESFQFKILDAMGSTLMRDQVSSTKKINTSEFKSGVYFISFEGQGTKPFTRKVIIRH
jgi:Secretion system C-terminal sorting domain